MKNRIVLNLNSGQAFGPFSEYEAGEFTSIWGNVIPNLIVIPVAYQPVTQVQAQWVADQMDASAQNN
jgi:hypothetical protein